MKWLKISEERNNLFEYLLDITLYSCSLTLFLWFAFVRLALFNDFLDWRIFHDLFSVISLIHTIYVNGLHLILRRRTLIRLNLNSIAPYYFDFLSLFRFYIKWLNKVIIMVFGTNIYLSLKIKTVIVGLDKD